MRGCPQNPDAQKGKVTGSRSQGGGEGPPPLGDHGPESSNMHHSQNPYIVSDAPYYGLQIDGEGASTSIQSPSALVPRSALEDLDILSAQNTPISGPDDYGILGTGLQFSAVTWGSVSSPSSQGHVDGSAVPLAYIDAGPSDWSQTLAHPSMLPERNQDTTVAQTLEEPRFHRQPDTSISQRTRAPLIQNPTAEMTASTVAPSCSSV
jgi:hypothetical protein